MDVFWADQLAEEAIARAKKEGRIVTCRGAASPSGGKHIGNLFDAAKAYMVHKAVLKKGYQSRFVFTHDDRDPLRNIPSKLPRLDGKWHIVDEDTKKELEKYLGIPYSRTPDPFSCCDSWSKHFATLWENGVRALGMKDTEFYFAEDMYEAGQFDKYIGTALEKLEASRKIIRKFQESKESDYIPFDAICANCGKIMGKTVSFDLEKKTVDYVCTGRDLAGKYTIQGCGFKGTTTFRGGKLPWSFEWPAQWAIWNATFEPFGKEHAEGSWPRCVAISKEIFGIEPPIAHIYEFLLINGEKMSTRYGNVYITQEMLQIVEPEVFLYFYTKRSKKQRSLDLKTIHLLVEDFEKAERVYFGKDAADEKDKENMARMYESSFASVPKKMPFRLPYHLAVMIANLVPDRSWERSLQILKETGHVKEPLPADDEMQIKRRLELAAHWLDNFAPEGTKIGVNEEPPKDLSITTKEKAALKELAASMDQANTEEKIYEKLYEIPRKHGIEPKDFFRAAYLVLISRNQGPRLAPFIMALGRRSVKDLLGKL
ncbi:MAG: lysine--tRNA ligase [Candidatus Aenigmarchaeota archaeon]|nr:lysine--tRNA ligase [Candidatus Aenigmarchaeota archaeon]